jgi:hypothetical protein
MFICRVPVSPYFLAAEAQMAMFAASHPSLVKSGTVAATYTIEFLLPHEVFLPTKVGDLI